MISEDERWVCAKNGTAFMCKIARLPGKKPRHHMTLMRNNNNSFILAYNATFGSPEECREKMRKMVIDPPVPWRRVHIKENDNIPEELLYRTPPGLEIERISVWKYDIPESGEHARSVVEAWNKYRKGRPARKPVPRAERDLSKEKS